VARSGMPQGTPTQTGSATRTEVDQPMIYVARAGEQNSASERNIRSVRSRQES
jgi:hypothetical protein